MLALRCAAATAAAGTARARARPHSRRGPGGHVGDRRACRAHHARLRRAGAIDRRRRNLLPWALAAGFARDHGRALDGTQPIAAGKRPTLKTQDPRTAPTRDNLAKVKIATLSAQVDAYAKASAVIVWDPTKAARHRQARQCAATGTRQGLPALGHRSEISAARQWRPGARETRQGWRAFRFEPDQPISKADKFAISVEPAGGVPQATGPIILLGGS